MRLLIQHRMHYGYPAPSALGPHIVRLKPASHTRAKIETYSLRIEQPCQLRWQQDSYGNHLARASFAAGSKVEALDLQVEMAVDIQPVNPFDFFVDDRCQHTPFSYPPELLPGLTSYLDSTPPEGKLLRQFLDSLPHEGHTVNLVVELNRQVARHIRYVIRDEPGVWTPEETLANGRGSCRDSARLLIAVLRSRGLAARFVSGYLVQLTDEGMIPDEPRGVGRDVVDLHAWTEVYLPGAGWIGLDSTSGLLCGEGHIPLAAAAEPAGAAPLEGTSSQAAHEVSFSMTVGRLGHEPRPTVPYEEPVWQGLLAAGEAADARLASLGLTVTSGGEPTFNSREHPTAPEWNGEALGPTKWAQGVRLTAELRRRLAPGAAVLERMGKQYPGESLPRWTLEIIGRKDGTPVWSAPVRLPSPEAQPTLDMARRLAEALARRLGAPAFMPAYEDPWRFLVDEQHLPVGVDPLESNLEDPEERRRLTRVLEHGLGREVGYVLPLSRRSGTWVSGTWQFRRGHLFLVPGDSPIGLRLPLQSLQGGDFFPPLPEPTWEGPPDPRREAELEALARQQARLALSSTSPSSSVTALRTALCVEAREGALRVFLPPLSSTEDFFALLTELEAAAREADVEVHLEGYPPPPSPELYRVSVTPDPGVLEVNVPPCRSSAEHAAMLDTIFEAALHAGLQSEKYLLDGRLAGSGGGHHITVGGPSPLESPLLQRPELLASLVTFLQHHPSLSYMFTGLFVGPTSQAPRPDEARHESLHELEIALQRAFESSGTRPPPWLVDALFRHLLVDLTGNTHRAEVCLDKLFDPATAYGRQGLVELRAFEMPPHPRMASAQVILVRSLLAALATEPYRHPLVRWGMELHDRFLLPYWMWRDFEDVLGFLKSRGLPLEAAGYRPFLELRCPLAGTVRAGAVTLEVRNAIEPWHVLGEELTAFGTARYVDSSMERIEVRAEGLVPERHVVLVNGHVLPMRRTGVAGEAVGGVRFRAWAPPHSLHPHLGIHHPIHLDVLDTWGKRSLGAGSYHVWHPEGRAFENPPLTRFEASARRAQRFTPAGPLPWPVLPGRLSVSAEAPYSVDMRRFPVDRPMPQPEPPAEEQ